jgi:hypothetical protein
VRGRGSRQNPEAASATAATVICPYRRTYRRQRVVCGEGEPVNNLGVVCAVLLSHSRPSQAPDSLSLDLRGQLLRAAIGFAGCAMPSYDRALHAYEPGSTPGPASGTSPSAGRARATTFNSRVTTRRGGERPSIRPAWSILPLSPAILCFRKRPRIVAGDF